MKKSFLLLFTLIFSFSVFAQGVMVSDNDSILISNNYSKIPETRSILPSKSSLVNYLPYSYIFNQGSTGMCVAYSLALARTILYAKNEKLSSKKEISNKSFSPLFIYYKTKEYSDKLCANGLNLPTSIDYVLANGFAKLEDVEKPNLFPYKNLRPNCDNYPPSIYADTKSASNYKVDNVYFTESIIEIKTAISQQMPVVFVCDMPFGLVFAGYEKHNFWNSSKLYGNSKMRNQYISGYHAMTIVGYDDNKYGGTFQIFNSWGDEWGRDGLIWIKYKDFIDDDFLAYAFAFEKNNEKSTSLFSLNNENLKIDSINYITSPPNIFPFNIDKVK